VQLALQEGSASASAPAGRQTEAFGLSVAALDEGGVEVVAVDPAAPAARAGVQPGDLILAVNQQEIPDLAAFARAVKRAEQARNVVLLVQREQMTLYIAFPIR
jgi:S1-C subfamily serine protease